MSSWRTTQMTREDFAITMAYLESGLNQPLPAKRAEVYWDLLKDLPVDALRLAAKRVLLEHKWATFPSVAELRQAASEVLLGQEAEMSPATAWELAWAAARRIDLGLTGRYLVVRGGVTREYESQAQSV